MEISIYDVYILVLLFTVLIAVLGTSAVCCCICFRWGKQRADKMIVTFPRPLSHSDEEASRRGSDMFSSATMSNRPVHTVTNTMLLELEQESSGSSSDSGQPPLQSNV